MPLRGVRSHPTNPPGSAPVEDPRGSHVLEDSISDVHKKLTTYSTLSVTQESLTMVWPESCTRTYIGSMWQIESHTNSVSSYTDVNMARLRSTLLTVAHRPPTLLLGGVSGQPHSNWWLCHDTGSQLLAAEHSLCRMIWNSLPDDLRIQQDFGSFKQSLKTWLFPGTSVRSALETFATIALYKLTYTIPYHTIPYTAYSTYTTSSLIKIAYDWKIGEGVPEPPLAMSMADDDE